MRSTTPTWACAALLLACRSHAGDTTSGAAASSAAPSAGSSHYSVEVAAPAACAENAECALTAKVTALGDYHVNPEYPFKLKMDDAPGVTFLGKDAQGPSTFSKAAGDFAFAGEKAGVMTVRYRATAGEHPVAGTFKLSVCTAASCLLEQAKVTATIAAR